MQVRKVKFNNKDVMIIYLTQKENEDEKTKIIINNFKEQNKEVTVFISGSNNMEAVLTRMVKEKM